MKKYGILAHPAEHSLSPQVHNAAFQELEIDGTYERFDIPPDHLKEFVDKVRREPISGLSVSFPHKEAIIEYLDWLSDDAKKIGAVNTVQNVNGRLEGYNVDWIGAVRALEENMELGTKKVMVIGAGGAARAIVYGLRQRSCDVIILNRTPDKAAKLANEFDCEYGALNMAKNFDVDVIVQTTSCWFNEPKSKLLPDGYLKPEMTVMDIVYKPLITPLLKSAKSAGATIITGEKMLLYQAYEQFELWTGKSAPKNVMEKSLLTFI